MVNDVKKMKHSTEIMQHYNLYKFYQGKDKTKANQNKTAFLNLAGYKKTKTYTDRRI